MTNHPPLNGAILENHLESCKKLMLVGSILSLLGFLMPWFSFKDNVAWSYGGLHLIVDEGMPWLAILVVGYLVMCFGGLFLMKKEGGSRTIVVMALTLTMMMLVVVGFASSAAVESVRGIDRPSWHLGIFVMIPGHAMMALGAVGTYAFRVLEEFTGFHRYPVRLDPIKERSSLPNTDGTLHRAG